MNLLILANCFTGLCEAAYFFILCATFLDKRSRFGEKSIILGVLSLGILIDVCNAVFSISIINLAGMFILYVIFSYFYSGRFSMRIICAVVNLVMVVVIEMLVLMSISLVSNKSIDFSVNNLNLRIIGIIISKIVNFLIIIYIYMRFKNERRVLSNIRYWLLFAIMFGVTILSMYTFYRTAELTDITSIRTLILCCILGLYAATAIVLFLFESMSKQSYVISKNNMLEVQLKEQLKHYDNIMMTQGQVKKIRHDLENHLYAIKAYIEKDERENCLEYIEKLFNNISKSDAYIDTGNTVLDAILTLKKTVAEEKNIKFNTKICIPKDLPMSHEDECIIFGNALDNAIEACDKVKEDRYINVYIQYDRDKLICKIINSCASETGQAKATTKKDEKNHGIGTDNIMKALDNYKSISKAARSDNEYELFFIIMDLI